MARHGRNKKPFYRVVVTDKENPRDGRFIELIGTVNPLTDPPTVNIKEDRVKYWIGEGAIPSDTIANIIEKLIPGYWSGLEEKRIEGIRSKRAQRKARAGARVRTKKTKQRGKKAAPAAEAGASA
jgi:small subunit ribosomal protein S16